MNGQLEKYQVLDEDVLDDLNNITLEEEKFNGAQRERYISLMKKHYQNIKYEIKDEEIDGDNAVVTIELEVMDYNIPMSAFEIMEKLGLKSKDSFRDNYLNPALECGLIKMTLPDKPTSKNQMYYKD